MVERECQHGERAAYCHRCENLRLKELARRLVMMLTVVWPFIPDEQKRIISPKFHDLRVELSEEL